MLLKNLKSHDLNTSLPRYQQLKTLILEQIQAGELRPSDRVPSEQELVNRCGVSRMTANRALRELARDGYLVRQAGIGTFVADLHAQSHVMEVRNIADEIRQRGHIHSADVITLKKITANQTVSQGLHLSDQSPVFHSVIVHRENDQPIQIEDRHVCPAAAPAYLQQDFTQITPNEYLSVIAPLQTVEHTIRAIIPDDSARTLLNMTPDEPGLLIRRRTWSNQKPVSVVDLCHPGLRYELEAHFEPQLSGPTNMRIERHEHQ